VNGAMFVLDLGGPVALALRQASFSRGALAPEVTRRTDFPAKGSEA
jgi:hypothetical protein